MRPQFSLEPHEPTGYDFQLYFGTTFTTSFTIYADPRVKEWRGEWNEWRVYQPGEGVVTKEGKAYVATLATQHTEPGVPPGEAFWSPVTPFDLTGYEVRVSCANVFEGFPEVEAKSGRINLTVQPFSFNKAPRSSTYAIQIKSPTGRTSIPFYGTMMFLNLFGGSMTEPLGHHIADITPEPSTKSQVLVATGAHVLFGWALTEPNLGAAKVIIRDGENKEGKFIAAITLNQNESTRDYFAGSIYLESGKIYLEVISGSIEGSVFWE